MSGGRDWLFVETDQPHSTRVIFLGIDLQALVGSGGLAEGR